MTIRRDLVKNWLEGRSVERPPIVLHIGPYAARLQQLSYQEMCGDPTLLANSMQSAERLFGCDGLILLADPTIEAEACGCEIEWQDDEPVVTTHPLAGPGQTPDGGDGLSSGLELQTIEGRVMEGRGRLATVLEAAERLAAVIGKDLTLMPATAGPATLASYLRGPAFQTDLDEAPERAYRTLEVSAQMTLLVSRRYLDMGFDRLVVSDPMLGRIDPSHFPAVASALRPLLKVADFYDAQVLLQIEIGDAAYPAQVTGIGAHGLLVQADKSADAPLGPVTCTSFTPGRPLGVGVPASLLEREGADLERALTTWREEACPAGTLAVCLTVPRSTPPENLHVVLEFLRR